MNKDRRYAIDKAIERFSHLLQAMGYTQKAYSYDAAGSLDLLALEDIQVEVRVMVKED